jgi:hypothetical protein
MGRTIKVRNSVVCQTSSEDITQITLEAVAPGLVLDSEKSPGACSEGRLIEGCLLRAAYRQGPARSEQGLLKQSNNALDTTQAFGLLGTPGHLRLRRGPRMCDTSEKHPATVESRIWTGSLPVCSLYH